MAKVLVVGASVGGSIAANTLRDLGVDTILLERDLNYVKPCGGAVPPRAFTDWNLPHTLIDRKVTIAVVCSPRHYTEFPVASSVPNPETDFIAMVRREKFDRYIRERAVDKGAELIEGKLERLEVTPKGVRAVYEDRRQKTHTLEVDAVIGADGAYSTVARSLGLPRLPMAIAYQERIRLPERLMEYWHERAALYLGDDVSPDLYAWVFPKYDHVAAGIGAGAGRTQAARQLLANLKHKLRDQLAGGESVKFEAHHLPMHPRKHLSYDRVALIGDAAGLVQQTSGEGIYWAMRSGEMAARAIVKHIDAPTAANLRRDYDRLWWRAYRPTYLFLAFLQRISYNSDLQREIFAHMCDDPDVQRLTFDGYLTKHIAPAPLHVQLRITAHWIGTALREWRRLRQLKPAHA
ncbi:MAG: geranylgeranyl diphosphate reductase [Thermoflexales bacterium]|nr:geranylgeranyl diphosphate reductase [Thermoflexales bacterium]MCS7325377.1 geranylgeranyl diphosphate reductase [Thermoflexales bacterium]MDW8052999.1 geranylgeranyl diphosphate reductase [Anaerolineae bacterium]